MSRRARLISLALIFSGVLIFTGAACKGGGDGAVLPELTPFPLELQARLHEIRDRAAGIRGLAINPDAEEGQLTREVLRQYIEGEIAKATEDELHDLEAYNIAFRLLHLIGADDDLLELASTSASEDILGFFFSEEDKLVLVAEHSNIGPQDELVLAHQYIHSFQHGAYDLDMLEDLVDEEDKDDETRTEFGSTISCLKEGDASLAMAQYGEAVYGPDWYDKTFGLDDDEPSSAEEDLPAAMQRYLAFDYNECATFVKTLYDEGGWDAIARVYADPPRTTEQILHPEKYRSRETFRSGPPESLEKALGDDWERLELDVFGEFDVYNYVASVLNDEFAASIAAAGWGSGWVAIYATDADEAAQDVLVHLRFDWDTDQDFQEFLAAYAFAVNTVSEGNWTLQGDDGPVQWEGPGEYGYVTWNRTLNRVEIVITTQAATRDDARRGL